MSFFNPNLNLLTFKLSRQLITLLVTSLQDFIILTKNVYSSSVLRVWVFIAFSHNVPPLFPFAGNQTVKKRGEYEETGNEAAK